TARLGLAAGVVNGVLYAVGGYNSNGALSSLEAYDPATGTWTAKASMSSVRYEPGGGVVGGTLYAVGGADNSNNLILSIATVEAYDPASNSWTWQASMATAREALPVATVNGALYAVGGYSSSGNTGANEAFVPPDDDSRLAQLTGGNNFI